MPTNPSALCAALILSAITAPALAQRVTDNAVTSAEDAFGTSIGNERVGLYSSSEVRGFSPITANNIRLEGLYMDRPASFTDRLVESNVIRVGLTAQNYLFPAPTGIVDYRIRPAGNKAIVSTLLGYGTLGGGRIEVDAQLPVTQRLSLAAGVAVFADEYASGSDAILASYGIAPRWRPATGVEIIPFWSRFDTWDREATPLYAPARGLLPRPVRRRAYPGPDWADQRASSTNYGGLAKVRLDSKWSVAAGLFRSVADTPLNHAHILANLTPDGTATRRITRDPGQRAASTSGELRVSRSFVDGERLHVFHAAFRGRDRRSLYGGGAAIDFGRVGVEDRIDSVEPAFVLGDRTRERVTQMTGGVAYDGRWRDIGSLSLGLQRTDYRKTVDQPGEARATTNDPAWLYNASLAIEASGALAFYGSYTRGLEESGIAPDSAANRTQALPAILTRQIDAGVRWTIPGGMRLVAGVFEVTKPYFAADERNVFTELGEVRHRGLELSIAGSPLPRLTTVAGAVLMRPRVSGQPVEDGRVGNRPIGQTGRLLTFNAQYALAAIEGLSLTFNATHRGARVADSANLVEVPSRTILDAGMRHRLTLGTIPALLRLQVTNLTNAFDWQIVGSGSYQVNAPRSMTLFLTMDL